IFEHVPERYLGGAHLLSREAVKHKRIVGIGTVRTDNFQGCGRRHSVGRSSSLYHDTGSPREDLKMERGGHPIRFANQETFVGDHPICASRAAPKIPALPIRSPEVFR